MVISDTKKFIFLHNPKTAGSALRKELITRYDTRNNFYWGLVRTDAINIRVDKAHMSMDIFRVLYPQDYELLEKYFVFSFTRNPFDRYVSSFFEYIKHHRKDINLAEKTVGDILEMLTEFTNAIDREAIAQKTMFRHFIPQHKIIYDGLKCKSDFTGKIETIEADFAKIKKLAGLDDSIQLSRRNQKPQRFSGINLSDKIIQKILDIYERDFLYFNFPDKPGCT